MSDDEDRDRIAAYRAATDQFQAAVDDLAATVAKYHIALLLQGLERREALELTRGWQALLFDTIADGITKPEIVSDDGEPAEDE